MFALNAKSRKQNAIASVIVATARERNASAFALTASIIALIAGKRAKFVQWKPMTDAPVRVSFHLDPSPVLAVVLRGAVHFQACNAGLETEMGEKIASATEDVCRESISQLADGEGGLDVSLSTFSDRIEVSIMHRGNAVPPVGLETFTFSSALGKNATGVSGLELLSQVDRVLYDNEDDQVRTTLVKFLPPKA